MAPRRKNSGTAKRSAPSRRSSGGKRRGRFGNAGFLLLWLLAAFGVHSALRQWWPGYAGRAREVEKTALRLVRLLDARLRLFGNADSAVVVKTAEAALHSPFDNLKMGVPSWNCDIILDREGYALGYSKHYQQPLWVSYKLTAAEASNGKARRTENFRTDPMIPGGSAAPEDYQGAFYDRGHLAPAADMTFSLQAMSESFLLSNVSPQKAEFNAGIWRELEAQVRQFAAANGEVYVVTGPIFQPGKPVVTIGASRVAVPHAYYKVVLDATPPDCRAIGFILPHRGSDRPLREFAVTVDTVERATGLNFFDRLDPELERKLESECDFSRWTH